MQPDPVRALEVISEVMQIPFQVVQREVNYEWTFAINHFAGETQSDDDPPIRITPRSDTINIDGVLGTYDPAAQMITIFRKGIAEAAEILCLHPNDLTFVVRIHEWAHALLHLGLPDKQRLDVTRDEQSWPECLANATAWFNSLDPELHERLAQLLTYHALRSIHSEASLEEARAIIDRMQTAFTTLTKRAGPQYQIDEFVRVPKARLFKSIHLLKGGALVGAPAWKTVVTW